MAEPVETGAPAAVRRTPRRRRSPIVALLALALVLAGRGLGWFGGGGADPRTAIPGAEPAPAADAPGPVADPEPARRTPPRPDGETPPPAIEPPPAPPAPGESTPPAASGVDTDRFASLLSLVSMRQERGELGGALAVLQRTAALPLDAAQQQQVRAASEQVRAAVEVACDELRREVAAGAVLAAAARCRALLQDGADQLLPMLAARLELPGGELGRLPERNGPPWPIAVPPARDRQLRTQLAHGPVTGRVVDGRSDQATLRVETEHGVTFPTVAIAACEPVDPTADEAVEAGLAALQAGDALLARLWLCCARLRGPAASPRAARLQEILQ